MKGDIDRLSENRFHGRSEKRPASPASSNAHRRRHGINTIALTTAAIIFGYIQNGHATSVPLQRMASKPSHFKDGRLKQVDFFRPQPSVGMYWPDGDSSTVLSDASYPRFSMEHGIVLKRPNKTVRPEVGAEISVGPRQADLLAVAEVMCTHILAWAATRHKAFRETPLGHGLVDLITPTDLVRRAAQSDAEYPDHLWIRQPMIVAESPVIVGLQSETGQIVDRFMNHVVRETWGNATLVRSSIEEKSPTPILGVQLDQSLYRVYVNLMQLFRIDYSGFASHLMFTAAKDGSASVVKHSWFDLFSPAFGAFEKLPTDDAIDRVLHADDPESVIKEHIHWLYWDVAQVMAAAYPHFPMVK